MAGKPAFFMHVGETHGAGKKEKQQAEHAGQGPLCGQAVPLWQGLPSRRMRLGARRSLWQPRAQLSQSLRPTQGFFAQTKEFANDVFPPAVEKLTAALSDPAQRAVLTGEMADYARAVQQNSDLCRFRFNVQRSEDAAERLQRTERMTALYAAADGFEPARAAFITQDEIDWNLTGGSGYESGAERIELFFSQPHDVGEKIEFLKREYGTGGRMPGVSNARHSEEWHDTKGIQLRKNGCQNVTLGWNKVAERIDTLIRNGRYTRLKEQKPEEEIRLVPDMEAYRNLKAERPQYMVGVRVDDYLLFYGEDAKTAAPLLNTKLLERDIPGVGMFLSLSFRAAMGIILALIIGMIFGKRIIRMLQRHQIGEEIRNLGLEGQLQKRGTPTMGGIIILASILIPILLFGDLTNIYVLLMIISTVWLGLIGFLDDYIKVFRKNKEGLNGRFKIIGQVGLGIIVGLVMWFSPQVVVKQKVARTAPDAQIEYVNDNGTRAAVYMGPAEKTAKTTIPFVKNNEFDYHWLIPGDGPVSDTLGWIFLCVGSHFL